MIPQSQAQVEPSQALILTQATTNLNKPLHRDEDRWRQALASGFRDATSLLASMTAQTF